MQAELNVVKLRSRRVEAVPVPLGPCLSSRRLRWHLLSVAEGHEQAARERVLRLLPEGLVTAAFIPRRERFVKKDGRWLLRVMPLWRGYVVVITRNSGELAKALARTNVSAGLVGVTPDGWAPLASEMEEWLDSVLDAGYVARASVGNIDDEGLHVVFGPLAGQEGRVVKIDRHRRQCWVRVCGVDVPMPLEVPMKTTGQDIDSWRLQVDGGEAWASR